MPDIYAKKKTVFKHKLIKRNGCRAFLFAQLKQKVNKNVKECGNYLVIKIHKFTLYEKCQWQNGALKWHNDKLQCTDGKVRNTVQLFHFVKFFD